MAFERPRPSLSGVVLAGGSSRRFPPNKLALLLDGVPLLWHPLRSLAAVCDEIVVVIGHDAAEPALPSSPIATSVVRDAVPDAGPVAGLASALAAARGEWVLVVAGDTPRLRPELLRALWARARDSAGDGAVLLSDGRPRPLPAVLRRAAALAAVRALPVDTGPALRDVVAMLDVELIEEAWWRAYDPAGSWREDIDRPEDLGRAERTGE